MKISRRQFTTLATAGLALPAAAGPARAMAAEPASASPTSPAAADAAARAAGDILPIELGQPGDRASSAARVNRRGQVLLSRTLADGTTENDLWESGRLTPVRHAGAPFVVSGLNDNGTVVGLLREPFEEPNQVVLWSRGTSRLVDIPGGTPSQAEINNSGQILVRLNTGSGSGLSTSAVLWSGGQVRTVVPYGPSDPLAFLNDAGQVAYEFRDSRALWTNGRTIPITAPDAVPSIYGLDNWGTVVGGLQRGELMPGQGSISAFCWNNGSLLKLPGLGGWWANATSVADNGLIAGIASRNWLGLPGSPGFFHAVLWHRGRLTDIGVSAPYVELVKVNNRGQVFASLGDEYPANPTMAVWQAGTLRSLRAPDGAHVRARDFSDAGLVVGTAVAQDDLDGPTRAVLWRVPGA